MANRRNLCERIWRSRIGKPDIWIAVIFRPFDARDTVLKFRAGR